MGGVRQVRRLCRVGPSFRGCGQCNPTLSPARARHRLGTMRHRRRTRTGRSQVESHESLKRQVRGGRVAEFGACAGQGLPFAGVGSAILHFCRCCPGQARAGDRAASTEDTDLKQRGGEAQKLEKAGWGWVGSPTSAPGQGRAFLSAVWAVHSYTFPCAAAARHRLGTGRHRRRTRTRRSQAESWKRQDRGGGGLAVMDCARGFRWLSGCPPHRPTLLT